MITQLFLVTHVMNTAVNNAILSTQAVRKLGAIEMRMALFHANLNGSTQGTQAIFFSANVSSEQFMKAANYLYDHYEALQCTIRKVDEELWFYRSAVFSNIPVRHLQLETSADINTVISECLDQPIDPNKALWRAQLVSLDHTGQKVFLFSAHHAIIDANGMHDLANRFFQILSAVISNASLPRLQPINFPLAVDELLQQNASPVVVPTAEPRPHDKSCPINYRRTGWQFVTLKQEQIAALDKALQADNIKLHSLISAALCQALHAQGVVAAHCNFGTAVSLRFLQDTNPEYSNPLGCYMSIATTSLDINDNLVDFARKYDRELMHKIFTSCLNRVDTLYADFEAATHRIAQLENFSQDAGITNMGHVAITETYPGIEISDYLMLANRVSANFSIVAHCYDFLGTQRIGLVYPKPCLADDVVARVAADLEKRLLSYSQR
jgi:hypothetical protein